MSEAQESPLFTFDDEDPAMQAAHRRARATFRYFWREITWERHRIVPALDMTCVKAAFTDPPTTQHRPGAPEAEQMWFGEIDFDGRAVTGVLLNTPHWLTSIKAGDPVSLPLERVTDWLYVIDGTAYGAFTVAVLRARMDQTERREHDGAWGLRFGDPDAVRLAPYAEDEEHPMCRAMTPSLRRQLTTNADLATARGQNGWTLLHQHTSAGNAPIVRLLLEHGADANAVTAQGLTPLQLAEVFAWDEVVAVLREHGAA